MSILYVHNDDIVNNTGIVLSNPTGDIGTYELKLNRSEWDYRKSITLSRASGAVTNYQMKLLVGESSGATGENVDCGGKCKTDFSDLRFTTSDKVTLLDYWIESISGTTPNQLATIWIEFDNIGTSNTTFYMYYGNSGASAVSNGENTFPFFDDFEGDAIDTDKWGYLLGSGGDTVAGSILTLAGTTSDRILKGKSFYGLGYATRFLCKSAHYNSSSYNEVIGIREDSGALTMQMAQPCHTNTSYTAKYRIYNNGNNARTNMVGWTANTYLILEIKKDTSKAIFSVNDANPVEMSTYYTTDETAPYFYVFAGGASISCDWTLVRQYLATEPAWGSWGIEEILTTPSLSWGGGSPTEITEDGVYTLSDGSNTIDATIDYSNLSTETTIDNVRVILTVSGSIILQSLPDVQIVKVGTTQQYLLTIVSSGGIIEDYITSDVTWSSSNENVATVTSNGLVTAISVGVTTITATYNDISLSIGIRTTTDKRTGQAEPERLSPHPYTYTATLGVSSRTGVK